MSNDLEIDLILYHKKIPMIYHATIIITSIVLLSLIIVFTYKYQTYYITKGKVTNNKLEILIDINDLKYLNNNTLYIDNKKYSFKLTKISKEIYNDNLFNTYKYAYLSIDNLTNIDNYVYEIKIPKEKKTLAKYLKDYL